MRHHIGPYTIVQCRRCLLAWTVGAEIDPAEFYDRDYFVGTDGQKGYNDYLSMAAAMRRTNRARLARLRGWKRNARTLLDVGCGPGFFVKEAWSDGLRACGLEVSEYAAAYGRDELGVPVLTGPLDREHLDRLPGAFELVTMWDVIEHLPEPDRALKLLADRMAPGGLLSLSTGDIASLAARVSGRRWHLFNLPEHLWFFSVPALRHLLERAGLDLVGVEREVCWFTAEYLAERLAFSILGRHTRLPLTGLLRRVSLPCTLLDVVTVHARKRAGQPVRLAPHIRKRQMLSLAAAEPDAQADGAVRGHAVVTENTAVCSAR